MSKKAQKKVQKKETPKVNAPETEVSAPNPAEPEGSKTLREDYPQTENAQATAGVIDTEDEYETTRPKPGQPRGSVPALSVEEMRAENEKLRAEIAKIKGDKKPTAGEKSIEEMRDQVDSLIADGEKKNARQIAALNRQIDRKVVENRIKEIDAKDIPEKSKEILKRYDKGQHVYQIANELFDGIVNAQTVERVQDVIRAEHADDFGDLAEIQAAKEERAL